MKSVFDRFTPASQAKVVLFALAFASASSAAFADPGLLLVAHGSPSPEWNRPVLDLGTRVADEVGKRGGFKAVRTALLEAAQPDVPTAVAELESAGCDRIIAVPLFVAPTGHTHFDVPAVLGIYSSPRTSATLAEEGAVAARPKVPITLTQTLAEDEILLKYALHEVQKLSKTPQDEALIVLAHGDPEHDLLAHRLMRRVTTYCCGEAGIGYGDWAFIGVGQEYLSQGVAAIDTALKHRERALVVGLYLSTTAAKIHSRSVAAKPNRPANADLFAGKDVALSEGAIIQHPEFFGCVLDTAYAAIAEPTGIAKGRVQPNSAALRNR
jgi:sirohydrochlorin ferrochelatase